MDPGDQLYTLDELRCWKVENLGVLDDETESERYILTKSGTKEELAVLCFSACKLNLPLVPSQDDILKDNKRCHDNILSECGITDPLQIYSGWLDEHDHDMQFWPPNFLTDITQFLLAHCSARTISSFCQTIIFFGAISIHCGGHHPVSVMVNTLFLKYTSCCCCST
jgi:hypothetical protein